MTKPSTSVSTAAILPDCAARRRSRASAAWLLALGLLAGVGHGAGGGTEDEEAWVRETLASLTLEQKVGQLLLPRVDGGFRHRDHAELRELEDAAREGRIGGVVVFAGDPLSTAATIARLQRAARVPLLVAADYEWGAAMRAAGASRFPRAMASGAGALGWGEERSRELLREAGAVTAREALAMGVQVVLAPVLDVAGDAGSQVIGTRSFGGDPRLVRELGAAFVDGVQEAGALAVVKHFPGHGATGADSHLELPVVAKAGEALRAEDLVPFSGTAAAGLMAAHVAYPALDPTSGRPASRSPVILQALLRGELGYRGLVLADALDMAGASGEWDGVVAVDSVAAGVDLLLLPPEPRAAWDAVVRAVRRGELSADRVDAAVRRVLAAKARVARPAASAQPDRSPSSEVVGDPAAAAPADEMAERALTLVADPASVLPLDGRAPPSVLLLTLARDRDRPLEPRFFAEELARRAPLAGHLHLPLSDLATLRIDALDDAAARLGSDVVVVADYAHHQNGDRTALRAWLAERSRRGHAVVYAAFADPWVLRDAPDGAAAIATFDPSPASERALARALFGEIAMRGRLPVVLDVRWPVGHGLVREAAALRFEPSTWASDRRDPRWDLAPVIAVLEQGVRDGVMPGAVAVVGYRGEIVLATAVGRVAYEPDAPAVRLDTLYDLASLTKVVATTTLAMLEVERGRLDLEASIATYLPELRGGDKAAVRVADLLAHSGGLLWWTDLYRRVGGLPVAEAKRRALAEVLALPLESVPGTATVYSDLGILLLGEILERLAGLPIDTLASQRIFEPLGMTETRYRPGAELRTRIAPTEHDPWRGRVVHGEVHDENAAALGGVAPHAGLFSTAGDLAVFAQMLLDGGTYGKTRLLRGDTIARFARRAERAPGSSRGLGWDTPSEQSSAGRYLSASSFGHTGFTGTSLWIDPERELFAVLLTNRVHPTRDNRKILELRPRFHDAVARALLGEAVLERASATP